MSRNFNLPEWNETAYLESYSVGYFDAADLFARNAQRIELECGTPDDLSKVNRQAADDHFSYVAGSIFMANASLSAAIDEVFRDADRLGKHPNAQTNLNQLQSNAVKTMAKARKANAIELSKYLGLYNVIENTAARACKKDPHVVCLPQYENWFLVDKFQLALYLADLNNFEKTFDLTDNVWKNAVCLRKLRNYLVHYEPEWIKYTHSDASYDAKNKTKVAMNCLKDRGFKNKLYPKDARLREGRMKVRLGADCAEWAVNSSSDFLYEFYERMPINDLKFLIRDRRTYKTRIF